MKTVILIIALSIVLAACTSDVFVEQTESSAPQLQSAAEVYDHEIPTPLSEQLPMVPDQEKSDMLYIFDMPNIKHIYKDEMLRIVSGFGFQFPFPQFESVSKLDFSSHMVGYNLCALTIQRNSELLSRGSGISDSDIEEIALLIELYADEEYPPRGARRSDMTIVGREFFGEKFTFPEGITSSMIAPFGENSKFYVQTHWMGSGFPFVYYLIIDIVENTNTIAATFLPFVALIDPAYNEVFAVELFRFNELDSYGFPARLEVSLDAPVIWDYEADPTLYLIDIGLPVPQDQLGTITVTFETLADGSLVAVSSVYDHN